MTHIYDNGIIKTVHDREHPKSVPHVYDNGIIREAPQDEAPQAHNPDPQTSDTTADATDTNASGEAARPLE